MQLSNFFSPILIPQLRVSVQIRLPTHFSENNKQMLYDIGKNTVFNVDQSYYGRTPICFIRWRIELVRPKTK